MQGTNLILITSLLMLFACSVGASNYDGCLDQAMSTVAMRSCIFHENEIIDKKLNVAYVKLFETLPKSGQLKLKTAQRAWLKFRGAECIFSGYQEDGGTLEPVIIDSCYLDMTKKRLSQLEKYIKSFKTH